jgi:hypothetical protein
MYVCMYICMKFGTIILPPLLLRNYNYNYNAIYTYRVYILYEVAIIFPQSLLHYKHSFSPLRKTLYAGRVKLFVEVSELFTHAVLYSLIIYRLMKNELEKVLTGISRGLSFG